MKPRTCGLRFSLMDAVAIGVGVAATVALWQLSPTLAVTIPVVLGHFFLFCNVFRIPRRPELIWSAAFLVNTGFWILTQQFTWLRVLGVQLPITALLILLEMRKPTYHGIFSTVINRRHIHAYLRGD